MKAILPQPHVVRIDWELGDTNARWDLACEYAVENFGLPGGRYKTELTQDYMQFTFENPKDAMIFAMRWS